MINKNIFLNIITPCSRPQNLIEISKSINLPEENYRWIVVFDLEELPNKELIPDNCETYCHKNSESISGNAQRNYALDMIENGYVYFNDDDTVIHPELWDNINYLTEDFISFRQLDKSGFTKMGGNDIRVGGIDTHQFITHKEIIGDTRWIHNLHEADGHFAVECYKKSNTKIWLDKYLSIYNLLR